MSRNVAISAKRDKATSIDRVGISSQFQPGRSERGSREGEGRRLEGQDDPEDQLGD